MNLCRKCVTFIYLRNVIWILFYSIQDLQRDILIRIKLLNSDIRVLLCAIISSKICLSQSVMLPLGPKTDFTIYLQKSSEGANMFS